MTITVPNMPHIRGKIVGSNIIVEDKVAEMDQDTDYCLDVSDIIGDSETPTLEDSIDTTEADYDDHVEMLRLGLARNCKPEIVPEFCVMDGFTLYKGCKEDQIQLPPQHDHVASLLRLNYDDVMSAWCEDRSLWTDGKRPQTVPEYFAGPTFMVPVQNDLGLVPELGSGSSSTSEIGGRGARVTRYREKKRSRLLSKKIRYEVRKMNAESRPRMKGRFVKRTSKSRG